MKNGILIPKAIYDKLSKNSTITKIIGSSLYPIIAPDEVPYPYIVYSRTGIAPDYDKDGSLEDIVSVTVIAVSNDYMQSITLANEIRNTLELSTYNSTDVVYNRCEFTGITESYDDSRGGFIQTLTFEFSITK